jgi:hypothetical protein
MWKDNPLLGKNRKSYEFVDISAMAGLDLTLRRKGFWPPITIIHPVGVKNLFVMTFRPHHILSTYPIDVQWRSFQGIFSEEYGRIRKLQNEKGNVIAVWEPHSYDAYSGNIIIGEKRYYVSRKQKYELIVSDGINDVINAKLGKNIFKILFMAEHIEIILGFFILSFKEFRSFMNPD